VPAEALRLPAPGHAGRYEDFQWLAQEIQREGGEATLVRVQQIENVRAADVRRLFHEPRDHDYRQLAARYRKVLQQLDRKSAPTRARVQEELRGSPRTTSGSATSTSSTPRRRRGAPSRGGHRHAHPTTGERPPRGAADPRPHQAARPPVGHAPAAPHRPHRVGLAHQALHRSRREFVFAPPADFPQTRSRSTPRTWS
jgi:hypothetical protein